MNIAFRFVLTIGVGSSRGDNENAKSVAVGLRILVDVHIAPQRESNQGELSVESPVLTWPYM